MQALVLLLALPIVFAFTYEERELFNGLGAREAFHLGNFEKKIANLTLAQQSEEIRKYVATIPAHRRESYEMRKMEKNKEWKRKIHFLRLKAVKILGKQNYRKSMAALHKPELNRQQRLEAILKFMKRVKLLGQKSIVNNWAREEIPAGIQ
ncbi:unnamed protein product, partial [Mesorhabditis spiculigera]